MTLRAHLDGVSQLIIDWRKLELASWRTCLDTVQHQVERRAAKWWFFIYGLIDGFLQSDASSQDATGSQSAAGSQGSATGTAELVQALQAFMEESTLGEFSCRLQLLHAFLCQLVHMDQTHARGTADNAFNTFQNLRVSLMW